MEVDGKDEKATRPAGPYVRERAAQMLRLAKLAWFAQSALVECISAVIGCALDLQMAIPTWHTPSHPRHTHHPAAAQSPVGTEHTDADTDTQPVSSSSLTTTSSIQHSTCSVQHPPGRPRCAAARESNRTNPSSPQYPINSLLTVPLVTGNPAAHAVNICPNVAPSLRRGCSAVPCSLAGSHPPSTM